MGMRLNMMGGVSLVRRYSNILEGRRLMSGVSVFSAPNYVDTSKNKGAYINVDENYELHHNQFTEVPHPDIKPMAYAASPFMSMM